MIQTERIRLLEGDCLQVMDDIPDKSVDMILCDLPYGITENEWDEIISLDELWKQYKRVIRNGGAVVLFAQLPFDKILGASNLKWLKHEYVWNKNVPTGFFNANRAPLKAHENILVFYQTVSEIDRTNLFEELKIYFAAEKKKAGLTEKKMLNLLGNYMGRHYFTSGSQFAIPTEEAYMRLQKTGYFKKPYREIKQMYIEGMKSRECINTYNPQGILKIENPVRKVKKVGSSNWKNITSEYVARYSNYPKDVLNFKTVPKTVHPTQKPTELLEFLIRTYTNENDTVMDNCMGSGSTGVACVNTGRKFIGIEKNRKYFEIAKRRIYAKEG